MLTRLRSTLVWTAGSSVEISNCEIAYNKAQAPLADLSSCNIKLPTGTFTGMRLNYSAMIKVLADDGTNAIYSDPASPSLLSNTRPARGPEYITYDSTANPGCLTCGNGATQTETGQTVYFSSPITMPSLSQGQTQEF